MVNVADVMVIVWSSSSSLLDSFSVLVFAVIFGVFLFRYFGNIILVSLFCALVTPVQNRTAQFSYSVRLCCDWYVS